VSFPDNIWKQLRNKSVDKLISALLKDGFLLDREVRTERVYRHPDGRKVIIHYHKGSKTYPPNLLKALLRDIGWTENDLRRLKLIK
jgi:predicted RNA binding protein YcfA (HicA-like mRNA interferase family)